MHTTIKKGLIILLVLAVLSGFNVMMAVPAAAATTWYVDDNTCPGTGDGSAGNPFCKIQDAVDAAGPGDIILVASGQYNEDLIIPKPLTILGAGWDVCKIYAVFNYAFGIFSDSVTISGFYISKGYSEGIYLEGANDCQISNNYIEYNYYGIYLYNSSHNTISQNRIWHNDSDGIYLYSSPYNVIEFNDIAYNLDYSCPYLYSWDGNQYILDSQLLNNAPKQEAEKYDYDSLAFLTPDNGKYLLKLSAELDETVYINELKLITLDHPLGTQVVPDKDGQIYTLKSPYTPVTAQELDGTPCLDKVNARDGVYWTSNLENKDFNQNSSLRDGIILEFNKPAGATRAKIVVNYKNTDLPEFIHAHFGRLPEVDPVKHAKLHALLHSLNLEVRTGSQWIAKGSFQNNPGSLVARDNVQSIDVSGISANTLKIKLSSLTGLVLIDSVIVDYTVDEAVITQELSATTAKDDHGSDVRPEILAADSAYLVLEKGDYTHLTFDEPAAVSGCARSFIIKAKGYYNAPAVAPIEGEKPEELMEQFLADFQYAMRYHLEKYRPDQHCGIDLSYNNPNTIIRYNEIHENYGEGIYMYFSDNAYIKDNKIYSNYDTGIYLTYSSNCEIYCNDIYENNPTYRTGIHVTYNSSNIIIHYNNIFGNSWGVVNDVSSEKVDATKNWWGDSSGPGGSGPGGGDSVSTYVYYAPWLAQECSFCPLDKGIGGEVFHVNKVGLIAPWIALATAVFTGGIYLARRGERNSRRMKIL